MSHLPIRSVFDILINNILHRINILHQHISHLRLKFNTYVLQTVSFLTNCITFILRQKQQQQQNYPFECLFLSVSHLDRCILLKVNV